MSVKIAVYPIHSSMVYGDLVSEKSKELLKDLTDKTGYEFVIVDLKDLKKYDLPLILVQSGGSENLFKDDIYSSYPGPYYLLTYGSSNSLAASLEILTYIKEKRCQGEVLHGSLDYIASRLDVLLKAKAKAAEPLHRLGVMGKPSDWLISSDVSPKRAKEIFHINLVNISEEEVIEEIKKHHEPVPEGRFKATFDANQLQSAYDIACALDTLVKKHHLEGFTLRCFDIIKAVNMSACLGLALMNEKDIIASCEGDVPAMITAYSVLSVLHQHAFQANPQWIDPDKNNITFAHCTLPLDMADGYTFDTHFESGIGLGIHGNMNPGPVTVVKVSADLTEFYVEEGEILEDEYRSDRCRTQIVLHLDGSVTYFLKSSLGNHHQIVYGHHKKELKDYYESLGLREVTA